MTKLDSTCHDKFIWEFSHAELISACPGITPNLERPLAPAYLNSSEKALLEQHSLLHPTQTLGTEEASTAENRPSHLFFPSWGECLLSIIFCILFVFQSILFSLPFLSFSFVVLPPFPSLVYHNQLVPAVEATKRYLFSTNSPLNPKNRSSIVGYLSNFLGIKAG
jgi:hypothetical protein